MEFSGEFLEDPAMLVATGRQVYADDHSFDSSHELPYYTLELTYSGTMLRRLGWMRRFRPQPNMTLLLTPPATPYALRGKASGVEIWILFGVARPFLDCLNWPRGVFGIPELPVPRTPLGRQVLGALEDTHHYASSRVPRRELLAENALERLLLLAGQLAGEGAAARDARVQRALDLIHERYAEALSVADLAGAVRLSPSRFAHLFRQETGTSPVRYLEGVRLEQAQLLLLRTDLQVKQVAARVGFDDPYYFSTRFRRRCGAAPSVWRNRPAAEA